MVDEGQQDTGDDDVVNVHAENIPQILKDHDHWLLWDSSNDTPRRPHWKGNFSISYNDPDAWHTFEEALEAAESNPSWGIGFVTTDTPVSVIDLDGCRRTDGEFFEENFRWEWWVPESFGKKIAEYYKELSPSKTGVHLPVTGFDVPEWWADKSFEDAEHEGVDVLDNKFCTVTGACDGDLPVVDVSGDDQWLRNALADLYETITGEDPRSGPDTPSGGGYSPGDEWLQPADVQGALSHIDPDVGYSEWRNIGFAVAEYFRRVDRDLDDDAFDVALETFEDWSQDGEKWDREAEENAFNIIRAGFDGDAETDSHVTIGTLLHVAERNGWEMPDKTVRLAEQTVDGFIDEYPPVATRDPDDERPDPTDDHVRRLADAVGDLDEETFEARIDEIDKWVGRTRDRIERHWELANEHEYGDLVNENGQLMRVTWTDRRWMFTKPVLSFEFDVDSILDLPDEQGRSSIVQINPPAESEPEFELDVPPKVFNDVRRFKDEILSRVYSTTIEDDRSHSEVLDSIRHWIAEQDVPIRAAQYEMGLNEDGTEFVTPTGSITADGWTDDPDAVHIERGSKTNATVRSFTADSDDHDNIDTDEVAEMIELIAQSRAPARITAILGWWYSAPHRPRIFDVSRTFNPLAVIGRSGSGKTATLAALNQMWGMDTEPQSVSATKHAVLTGFAASRGVPVWFDEYRPEKTANYAIDRFHDYYKKSATGGILPKGNHSMGTDDWHFRSPIVVSGESEIRSNAERRRTVNVNVTSAPTEDEGMKQAFKDLVGDVQVDDEGDKTTVEFPEAEYNLQDHAVAYYSWVADMSEDEFRDSWLDARGHVAEFLGQHEGLDLGDTETQALQTVVFGWKQMIAFANAMGADVSKLPGEDALEDALAHVADVDGDGRQSHEDEFFSLVSRAAAAGYLMSGSESDNGFYKVVYEGKTNEELRVNVTRAFDSVSKYVRDHDLNADLLQSASDYKNNFDELKKEDTYIQRTKQNSPPIARCTGIDMARAVDEITGFSRESFVDVEDEGDDGEETVNDDSDSDGGDGDGPVPVGALGQVDHNYTEVTVKVIEWGETPDGVADAGGPVKAGSVSDTTGRVDIVAFDHNGDAADGSEHLEAGETVRIDDVYIGEYDGARQLNLDAGTTITPIQPGVGFTEGEEPDDGQGTLDGASDDGESQQESVLADGGDTEGDGQSIDADVQRDRVMALKDVIENVEDEHEDGAPVGEVREQAVEAGLSEDKFDHELAKLKTKGDVYEPSEGRLRTV
ncbi:PriCT-2 domain-containing protein [Halostella pelagica]|uniref:PriCT-2 domain-containing protein n=1 Tax=Halostella pelagica TaxID=2583824 RepID=UPI0010811D1D|nr:PriCT-2 domain-containing protein [Halostella pelagica]